MRRILLIGPPDNFISHFASRLREEGAQVSEVATGSEALAAAVDGYDLIVLDPELQDMDGMALLRQLRGGAGTAAILLLKAEGEPDHIVQRGLDFGASGYVVKHRLPGDLRSAAILDQLFQPANGRHDACPFSARREFGRCSVYLPLTIKIGENGGEEALVSCSHLRIGTSDTWRLYPRCAIGDQLARDRYLEDRTPA